MKSVFITGAGRGLGLALARLYAVQGWAVHAACRNPDAATGLHDLAQAVTAPVTVHELDMERADHVAATSARLGDTPVDVLLHVAGYFGSKSLDEPGGMTPFGTTLYDDWERLFRVNVAGVMRLSEALVDNVAASQERKIVAISSRMGSIGGSTGQMYGYRASKAALNAIVKAMSIDLADRGISTLTLHPGWVKTEMGGSNATLPAEESAANIAGLIAALTPQTTGRFCDHQGNPLEW